MRDEADRENSDSRGGILVLGKEALLQVQVSITLFGPQRCGFIARSQALLTLQWTLTFVDSNNLSAQLRSYHRLPIRCGFFS